MLPQQARVRRRCGVVDVAATILDVLGVLIRGIDEARASGNDFSEAGGSLPAPGERSEAIDASNVGNGSKVVCDRRPERLRATS